MWYKLDYCTICSENQEEDEDDEAEEDDDEESNKNKQASSENKQPVIEVEHVQQTTASEPAAAGKTGEDAASEGEESYKDEGVDDSELDVGDTEGQGDTEVQGGGEGGGAEAGSTGESSINQNGISMSQGRIL